MQKKCYESSSVQFGEIAFDYLLTEVEANQAGDEFKDKYEVPDMLRDMHASSNRSEFARRNIEIIVEDIVSKREKITCAKFDEQIIIKAGEVIDELMATA